MVSDPATAHRKDGPSSTYFLNGSSFGNEPNILIDAWCYLVIKFCMSNAAGELKTNLQSTE